MRPATAPQSLVGLTAPFLALFVALSLALPACDVNVTIGGEPGLQGSGVEATETREVGAFSRVLLEGAGTLELSTGAATPLTMSGDDNLLPLIETTVTDGELLIRPRESISPELSLVFRVSSPDLTAVRSAGAAKIVATDLDAQEFTVSVHGAASVEASGRAGSLTIDVAGAGSVDTTALVARDVVVDLAGASNAEVHADGTLAVTIAGVGSVRYSGDAELVKEDVSGLGSVRKR